MKTAYDAGVNFFDNAEAYEAGQSEIVMGSILEKMGWPRDSFCVSSKVFFGTARGPNRCGLSRKHVTEACHAALKRLRVEYLDLYFCHRPDPETPVEETVSAMTDLIRQGKVLYWGTSEWAAADIAEAWRCARAYNLQPPTMEQPQYNLFHRHRVETEYAPLYERYGLGTTIWSPLASGMLTGKYNFGKPGQTRPFVKGYEWLRGRFEGEEAKVRLELVDKLIPLARELGISMPRLAIAWTIKNPNVSTAILGASKVDQLTENLKAMDDVDKLTPDVMDKIHTIVSVLDDRS